MARLSQRPTPFQDEHRQFWQDPYISSHILRTHLDDNTRAASRRRETIDLSSTWIAEQWDRHANCPARNFDDMTLAPELLDIGCGPGLYALRFQDLGFTVTGVDISPASIAYATDASVRPGPRAKFHEQDYHTLTADAQYDLVTCIYGGMGTISDETRAQLMKRIFRALKPGGLFVFDVFTADYASQERLSDGWFVVKKDGFWSPEPYLVLETSFLYPERAAFADSYTLVFEDGSSDRYFVWHRYYTQEEIRTAAAQSGFDVLGVYSDLCGTRLYGSSLWLGIVAQKP